MSTDDPSQPQVLAREARNDDPRREDDRTDPEAAPTHPTEPREQITPYDHLWYRRRPQE